MSRSAFPTSKHQDCGGQTPFSTSGGLFQARKPDFGCRKHDLGCRKPIIECIWRGASPPAPLWRLRRVMLVRGRAEYQRSQSGAHPAPAKCAFPPAWPAKCTFPSLPVVSLLLLYAKNQRPAPPVIKGWLRRHKYLYKRRVLLNLGF